MQIWPNADLRQRVRVTFPAVGQPKCIVGVGNRIEVEVKMEGWMSLDWRRHFRSQSDAAAT